MRSAYFMLLVSELVSLLLRHFKASGSIISVKLSSYIKVSNSQKYRERVGRPRFDVEKVSEVIMLIMKILFLTITRNRDKDVRQFLKVSSQPLVC